MLFKRKEPPQVKNLWTFQRAFEVGANFIWVGQFPFWHIKLEIGKTEKQHWQPQELVKQAKQGSGGPKKDMDKIYFFLSMTLTW